ncbi:DUF87 domain-containing protein [Rhodovastum atsumiense]|uniref:DUF87 domain-containing protein n=1 Tax=Rhodovastum atsumiense TaxID=504468 RepID=A0A5M6IX78_9PROT|nr:ATP-binding protein [Rhodovastum atsumiense]KAA5612569.1 DUF87 domain-containing protein [Rhodovastum atsumiense]CAH2601344.1 DUF87 domain-containing protein [Rhodovastum atsumiense]
MARPVDPAALAALGRAEFHYTRDLESIWTDSPGHVPELNGDILRRLGDEFVRGTRPDAPERPLGWAVIGTAGAGKTHLLGALRRQVWDAGGWFVLLDLLDVNDFWGTTALGFVDSLTRPMPGQPSQGHALLDRLCARFGLEPMAATLADADEAGWTQITRALAAAIRREDSRGALAHRDVVPVLLALLSADPELQDFARAWLIGTDIEATGRERLRVMRSAIPPRKAVEGLSWLMALGGPTLCALDQIDAIVSVAHASAGTGAPSEDKVQNRALAVIDELAGGLMDLREVTRRTIPVVASLEATWETLCTRAIAAFRDRFRPVRLAHLGQAEIAARLVERRLAAAWAEAGYAPPYPTWPFRPEAFAGVTLFSPRQLLQACRQHVETCLATGEVTELAGFANATAAPVPPPRAAPMPATPPAVAAPVAPAGDGAPLDARYDALCALPPPAGLLELGGDDARVVELLLAGLRALERQTQLPPTQDLLIEQDIPGLHARLRLIDHAAGGQERHHGFRAIPHANALAVQTRLQQAITGSGIDRELPFRRLIILRRGPWPGGPKTAALVRQFELRGGDVLAPDAADFARFAALQALLTEAPPGLDDWLRRRRPLAESAFFRALGLGDAAPVPAAIPSPPSAPVAPAGTAGGTGASFIPLGLRAGDRTPVRLPLSLLPRHVAVVAGAGSGKTVLLRRLVEEAALAGIPAIVLDSNNDLVRLADPWPGPPLGFTDDDAARAAAFFRRTEVVVWTPGRARGNPLSLAPLPDFAALGEDAEERDMAVGVAAATLEPLIPAGGAKGQLRMGVLVDALRHFARAGGGRLQDLVTLLRDLPAEASDIGGAPKLAAEVADALLAARSRNPLLEGEGTVLDPAVLLGGTDGRVRISVVNLAGLPGEEARQDFVGRLLMALFSHVRRHPAGAGRPACGLLVMDEAQTIAPSDRGTPSRAATVALVRQARKYGLGMVFATQAPKAIDHNIVANCTTQLFGLTNSPAALDAVRELLRSRGGGGEDLGRLPRGQFYLTTEGADRPQKLLAPLCLSWHPANPPSEEEVLARAAQTRTAG